MNNFNTSDIACCFSGISSIKIITSAMLLGADIWTIDLVLTILLSIIDVTTQILKPLLYYTREQLDKKTDESVIR